MYLSESASFLSTRSDIPRFQQKDINSGRYGGILYNYIDNPRLQIQNNYTTKWKAEYDNFKDA